MFKSDRLVFILGSIAFFLLLVTAFVSEGDYQGGDTYLHYLTARYSFVHPELFLDHWGKPLFTLIYSPVAQVSYECVRLFTVLIAGATGVALYRWSLDLGLPKRNLTVVFLFFSPIYIWMSVSSMTEVLFGFWLVIGSSMLTKQKWVAASIWLSFLPFIRTEGFILLPFIATWLLFKRQWRFIPLFAVGTVLYSLIGGFFLNDFLWIINRNPYPMRVNFYGSGSWFHFLISLKSTWGVSFFISMCLGVLIFWKQGRAHFKKGWFLVVVPALVYFLFHTAAWATGTMASLGEIRVMAAIMPVCALMAANGANWLSERFKGRSNSVLLVALFLLLGMNAVLIVKPPIIKKKEVAVMSEVADYVGKYYSEERIWCTDIQIAKELNRDIWNKDSYQMYLLDTTYFSAVMKKDDIIIWDAHYSPNEGGTPLDNLLNYKGIKELKRFHPKKPFKVLGGLDYEVVVFVVK